ncbi:NAD(P)H-dependent flavin oxidoreductase [Octadecabacter ascidiaceicola]|uniref:Nitronate monooxygenase n=1 Tax=Octadecabacter ascidiaceicola TaxID=1655543 RepID=A0A238K8J4_9RHOB|nr:nitronate monooxygenase [Octadecabacter ascidiaceicola]SMX38286.1 Nitronate monooxygenase [Octadecabacter ascidiaceicola]
MKTRLTDVLDLKYPIIQAPMAFAAGGALAAATSHSGALGMIGGGYGDLDWIDAQFEVAGQAHIGCGLITWALADRPWILRHVIKRNPKAIYLSFGDPAPYAEDILNAGIPLICQVQTWKDARRAIEVGANVVVAQGSEAGGHGENRGTMTLVPEVFDEIAKQNSNVALVAAGGIADGRGLAASFALGADGVVVGTRYWASKEALVHPRILANALAANGDDTLRTRVLDIVRDYDWPRRYTARAQRNAFLNTWHGSETDLLEDLEVQKEIWADAQQRGDTATVAAFAGEGLGLIDSAPSAQDIAGNIIEQASSILVPKFKV